jgi:epoxyqueuosine reductase QueG
MDLQKRIADLVNEWGLDFFGVADLALASDAILEQGGPEIAEYPRAISVGIALLDSVVDQLPRRTELAVALSYRHHGYKVVNQRLDIATSRLSGILQHEGYRGLPVAASQHVDEDRLCGSFSHKMAAHLSGLGWIGKSCLLVTPEVGPRVRWATILTDAPLEATGESMDEQCGNCVQCVEICPPKAFSGAPFQMDEPREVRFDAHKCDRYVDQVKEETGEPVCGMCLYICPHGRG